MIYPDSRIGFEGLILKLCDDNVGKDLRLEFAMETCDISSGILRTVLRVTCRNTKNNTDYVEGKRT